MEILDEKITIETARLAKEKNFNVMVRDSFTEYLITRIDPEYPKGGGSFVYTKGEIEISSAFYFRNNDESCDTSNKNYIMYARPAQSILQRWLREIHKVDIDVHRLATTDKTTIGYHASIWNNINSVGDDSCDTKITYEEALEIGLQHALIII